MMSATSRSRPGLARSSENSCTPAGSSARKRSKLRERAVGSAVSASAAISSGCTSVSRSRARGDAHRRIAAVMPAADGRQHLRGLRVAHARQRLDGAGIVLLAGKHHVDAARASAPARPRTAPRSAAAPSRDAATSAARERVRVRDSPEKRASCEQPVGIGRQLVRLLVGDHLQPVLDPAQEDVGRRRDRRAPWA